MKKKLIISVLLVGLLAFGAGMGTLAYFSRSYSSVGNEVIASTFEFDTLGSLNADDPNFQVDKFAPGNDGYYEFKIERKHDLPVNYDISISKSGKLFNASSPIRFYLYDKDDNYLGELTSNTVDNIPYNPSYSKDFFTVRYSWPYGSDSSDNNYLGATGNVTINVVARQLDPSTNIKYAQAWVKDQSTNPNNFSNTVARVKLDNDGNILSLEAEDAYLGLVNYDGTNFTAAKKSDWNDVNTVEYRDGKSTIILKNSSQNHWFEITID